MKFTPARYFTGLTPDEKKQRYLKMQEKTYTPFPTDKGKKTRTSKHTIKFRKMYGDDVKTLPQIAKATGVPLATLRTVYNRGLAAWRTGHRPGATPQQWAYARVHSYVTKGKTWYTADKNLRKK